MTTPAVAPRATRREWIGLAVIALPCLLYSMDLTVLFLALPSLSADLNPSSTELLWITDIYGFMVAGSLITMGTLGDRIGRRKLLLTGAGLFGVASVLAAFSRSAEMLIATRALLGVAGATVAPSTLSLIRNMFADAHQRTVAIGVWVTSYSVGAVIGPLLGGLLLEYFWWGSVFLLAVPIMLLLLVVGPTLLPEYRDPNAGRLDIASAALSLVAVLSVIYGLKRIAAEGFSWPFLLIILAGLALGAVFVRRQQTLADPFIDLRLFGVPGFSASLATYLLSVFVLFGISLLTAQYLQLVLGLSPMKAGLWTLPSAGGFIAGSMTAPLIVRRVRPAFVMGACMAVSTVGFLLLAQVEGTAGLTYIVAGTVVVAFAIAPVVTLATDLIVGSAPPEKAGAASAISETGAEFGGALSIAMLGSIATAVYRTGMAGAIDAGAGPDAMTAAKSTLGGAVAAAERLPAHQGAALLAAARDAFARALEVTAGISAMLALATAIMAVAALRHVRIGGGAARVVVVALLLIGCGDGPLSPFAASRKVTAAGLSQMAQATDKTAALREIIEMDDPTAFLAAGGYDP
jgi:DHA2 family multidrug resistance protein-like MFS transporter